MSWNIQKPGDYINGPLTVTGSAGFGTTPFSDIGLSAFVATASAPATSGSTQTGGSFRIGAASTNGAMDMGTAGSYSWIQALNRSNLATNYNIVLNPNGGNVGVGATVFGGLKFAIGNTNDTGAATNGFVIYTNRATCSLVANGATDAAGTTFNYSWANGGQGPFIIGYAGGEAARFNSGGTFVLGGGNTTANGRGIAFPAAQSASTDANTLDDYEEGTWTPVLRGMTTAGSYTAGYTVGRYTKVGRVVTVSVSLVDITQVSAGSGGIRIDGLPFTIANEDSAVRGCVGELAVRQVNAISTAKNIYSQGGINSNSVFMMYFNGTDDVNIDLSSVISGSSDLGFTLTYTV